MLARCTRHTRNPLLRAIGRPQRWSVAPSPPAARSVRPRGMPDISTRQGQPGRGWGHLRGMRAMSTVQRHPVRPAGVLAYGRARGCACWADIGAGWAQLAPTPISGIVVPLLWTVHHTISSPNIGTHHGARVARLLQRWLARTVPRSTAPRAPEPGRLGG